MNDNEVLFQRTVDRLVRTGEWERLKTKLMCLLDESGWSRQMQENGREIAPHAATSESNMPTILELCDRMSTDAHRILLKDVRENINALLREALQRNYS
ncbi:hypothetical protein CPB85DRAFT_1440062 [Mucidula mucida]|nr:hypothetical protein CPB85DRAFT_1440062 [Mucidula mucida]